MIVRPGARTRSWKEGPVTIVELAKSALRVPIVASWHTNLHQYARLRLAWLPDSLGALVERYAFYWAGQFYRSARFSFAPTADILEQLIKVTGKLGAVMAHGVDTELFSPPPEWKNDGPITLGYVGRLTAEKNVRFLVEVAKRLPPELADRVRLLIVGEGNERAWLERHLPRAEFTSVLRGEALRDAFRAMDIFLFPSRSDTFGLVLLEAMATGAPVVVFDSIGPDCALKKHNSWDAAFDAVYDAYGTVPGMRVSQEPDALATP
jgi:phosphatidylinositol alpha 1,6-mannosyltransferase